MGRIYPKLRKKRIFAEFYREISLHKLIMKKRILFIIAAVGLLCGCGYDPSAVSPVYTSGSLISTREESSVSSETSSLAQNSSASSTTSASKSAESSSTATTSHDYSEIPVIRLSFTSEEMAFAEKSLFIGDSICRGLEAYDVLSAKNVLGAGNVGARNIFDALYFRRGKDVDFLTVIDEENPRHVVFSMGMNDVNMTNAEEFCENYRRIIDETLKKPIDDVYVLSVTPICSDFTYNSKIVYYNEALKSFIAANYPERVYFVDIHGSLTDKNGELAWYFSSGDGVHLDEIAYYQLLDDFFSKVDLTEKPVSSSAESKSAPENETSSDGSSASSQENASSSTSAALSE